MRWRAVEKKTKTEECFVMDTIELYTEVDQSDSNEMNTLLL